MYSLRNILGKLVRDYGISGGIALNVIRKQWTEIVGKTVAAHTFPDTVKNKVLMIVVDTPQWMHHLSFYKEEITAKLEHYDIKEIRFRRGKIPERVDIKKEIEESMLNEEDKRYLENTLRNLKDDELKAKFRILIKRGLIKEKRKTSG